MNMSFSLKMFPLKFAAAAGKKRILLKLRMNC